MSVYIIEVETGEEIAEEWLTQHAQTIAMDLFDRTSTLRVTLLEAGRNGEENTELGEWTWSP